MKYEGYTWFFTFQSLLSWCLFYEEPKWACFVPKLKNTFRKVIINSWNKTPIPFQLAA